MRTRVLTWLFPARRAPWTLAPAHVTEAATLRALLHPLPQVWRWVRGGDAA